MRARRRLSRGIVMVCLLITRPGRAGGARSQGWDFDFSVMPVETVPVTGALASALWAPLSGTGGTDSWPRCDVPDRAKACVMERAGSNRSAPGAGAELGTERPDV